MSPRRASDPWFPKRPLHELFRRLRRRFSTWDEWIVLLFSLALAALCLYFITILVQRIFAYESIIALDNYPPDRTRFPGLTLCAPTIFAPKKLAEYYPEFRAKLESNYENIPIDERENLYNNFESLALANFSASEVILEQSLNLADILAGCRYYPVTLRHTPPEMIPLRSFACDQIKPVLPTVYYGRKCFTFFSHLVDSNQTLHFDPPALNRSNEDNENPNYDFGRYHMLDEMVYDQNPVIELLVDALNPMWNYINYYPMIFNIHPPNVLPNKRKFFTFTIGPNARYEVTFTHNTMRLKEESHHMECLRYEQSEEGKYRTFRTSDNCVSTCIQNYTFQRHGCSNFFTALTEGMFANGSRGHICGHGDQDWKLYQEAKWKCAAQCPEDCTQPIYHTEGRVAAYNGCYYEYMEELKRNELKDYEPEDLDIAHPSIRYDDDKNVSGSKCYTRILVKLAQDHFTNVSYKPAFRFEEYIGAIGGHIGIWLGMSIFSLVSVVIHTVYPFLAAYSVRVYGYRQCGLSSNTI